MKGGTSKRSRSGAGGMRRPLKRRRTGGMTGRTRAMPAIKISRTTVSGVWNVGVATTNDFWRYYQPTVSQFNAFPEFAALFDQYKVTGIKYTFYPRYDSVDANPAALTNTTVKMVSCVDPYSQLVPTGVYSSATLNVLMEQSGTRVRNGLKPISIFVKPQLEIPTNIGGGITFTPSSKVWLNTASTSVPFRGFHAFVATNSLSTPVGLAYDTYITWYITFKNLK